MRNAHPVTFLPTAARVEMVSRNGRYVRPYVVTLWPRDRKGGGNSHALHD